VIVSDREDAASAISAGATDWLIAPFSSSYARTKMRAWVLRVACRWVKAPIPEDEQTRLASLRELSLLDTDPNEKFDRVTRLAAACFDAPMSTITLIDQDRQWFMSSVGTSTKEDPRDASFCAHVVHSRRPMIVADTLLDSRFADNPLVVNQPRIRFYAGYPLTLDNGSCIGTLCVLDTRPRAFQQSDFDRLRDLASIVVEEVLHIRSLRQNEHQHADDRAARIGRS
jgi:GAF domain-containing protein